MESREIVYWIACILGGFLMGSIMFCQVIPKVFLKKDITEISDDHNPGAANVFTACGPFWGLTCMSLDVMKGFVPVFLATRLMDTENILYALVLAAPVLGHAIAPFNHFHGGKCIATSFGIVWGMYSASHIGWALVVIYITFSTVLKIKPNRIRSIAAYSLFGLVSMVVLVHNGKYSVAAGCVLISLIAIWKHSKHFQMKACTQAVE